MYLFLKKTVRTHVNKCVLILSLPNVRPYVTFVLRFAAKEKLLNVLTHPVDLEIRQTMLQRRSFTTLVLYAPWKA